MSTTYCPHCRRITNTRVVLEPPRRTPKEKEPALRVLHCTLCNGFIRSEEVHRTEEKDSGQELRQMNET